VLFIIAAILIIVVSLGFYKISDSREFQFFGVIISRFITPDKVVALTFDDGPSKIFTDRILNILSNENVKATFYLTGNGIKDDFDDAKKIVKAGHDIGNHTYSHKRMALKSWNFVKSEIENTEKLIRELGYIGEITFRPPHCKKLLILPYYLNKVNKKTITWNLEPDSIDKISENSNEMVKYVLKNIEPGSIILMHVMYKSREASICALPQIIQKLKKRGYSFLTITELLNKYYNSQSRIKQTDIKP
jgi:chitin deacetylase